MKKTIGILLIILVFLIQEILFSQNEKINFYNKTVKVKTVDLSAKVLIGDISTLDVDNKGRYLIVDKIGNAVYLFNENGHLLRTLSAEKCHPGFHWRPFSAKFSKEGNILTLNSSPWGFHFDSDGNCVGGMDISFLAPPHIAFLKGGAMVGYYNIFPNAGHHLKMMDNFGKEKFKFGRFPKEFEKFIYRFEGGGLIVDNNDYIYQVNVCDPTIFKYNKEGKFITSFVYIPSYYRKIERDFSSNNPSQAFKELPGLLLDKTFATDLFLFEPNKLMVQLQRNKFFGLQLYNLKGDNLSKEDIFIDRKVLCAKNGLIYFMFQPKPKANGDLPNPKIEIFKFK